MAQMSSLNQAIEKLKSDIARWQAEIRSGQLRGTTLKGMLYGALSAFEELLRGAIENHKLICGINEPIPPSKKYKNVNEPTLGELIHYLVELNPRLSSYYASQYPNIQKALTGRDLLAQKATDTLYEVNKLWKSFKHNPTRFANNETVLVRKAQKAFDLIATIE